jgi:hypothetical protein
MVVDGDLVKVMSCYDNEWGYANQMLREAVSVSERLSPHTGGGTDTGRERLQSDGNGRGDLPNAPVL